MHIGHFLKQPTEKWAKKVWRCIKNKVWRAVLQGKENVTSLISFFETAYKLLFESKIKVIYVSKAVVEKGAVKFKKRYSMCKSIPNTRSLHFIHPVDTNVIEYSLN